MLNILLSALAVSLVGAVLSLDRTAAFQTMLSRPIVTAPLVGYMLGAPGVALIAGITLELLFIGELPVGRHIPVHETSVAVLVASLAVTLLGGADMAGRAGLSGTVFVLPIALLAALPAGRIYHIADTMVRRLNIRLFESARTSLENGFPVSLVWENLKGVLVFFTINAIALLVTVTPLMAAAFIAAPWVKAWLMYPAFAACVLLGLSAALNAVYTEKSALIFSVSGAVSAVVLLVA